VSGTPHTARTPGPLRVSRVRSREFPGRSDTSLDPDLRVFVSDLARPYGAALREDLLAHGAGHSYGEMGAQLLADTLTPGDPVDLLLLAFAVPDVRPGRATALYLATLCPGSPQAFALCDQGSAAAFTALRLAGQYARAGDCRRAVLLVMEQSALHYEPLAPAPLPQRHTAVAIVCDPGGATTPAAVRQHPAVGARAAEALLAAEVADLSAGRAQPALVLGGGLTGALLDADTRARTVRAAPGAPYTGLWSALAGGLARWAREGRPVLLAEYDRALGYLCVAALDPAPVPGAQHGPDASPGRRARPPAAAAREPSPAGLGG
jgi:hypothetical protein